MVGLDANLAFYRSVYLNAYYAKSQTERLTGDDHSYRAQFNYTADRYGLELDRNVVEKNFNPEMGFLRRSDIRRSFASARFSPRTTNSRLMRKYIYQAELDYISDNENRLSTRLQTGQFTTEFHNSDTISVNFVRNYEFLAAPFQISRSVRLPVGGYTFQNVSLSYSGGSAAPHQWNALGRNRQLLHQEGGSAQRARQPAPAALLRTKHLAELDQAD